MSIADTTRGRLIALVQTVDDQREAIETFKANRAEAKAQLETVIAEIRSTIKDPEAEPRETMGKLAKLERQRIRRQLELDTVKANMTAAKGEGQLAASQILGILRDLRDGSGLFDDGTIDTATGELLTPEKAEQAAQVLNATGKAPGPLSPTDAAVAAIGAVVGVGPATDAPDDGRDAPSSTWDSRLTIAPHVASKKITPQCGDTLRDAGFSQLNDVQAFRVDRGDGWREDLKAFVAEKTGYLLTTRNLDGLDEAIEARLSTKGQ